NLQLSTHFAAGALGDEQELNKFSLRSTFKALGDIGHDRRGGSPNLIHETVIRRKWRYPRDGVNAVRQLPRALINVQIFERLRHASFHTIRTLHMFRTFITDGIGFAIHDITPFEGFGWTVSPPYPPPPPADWPRSALPRQYRAAIAS